ncbi:MAG: hypothetical protein EAZ99_10275 [Alphaproteobacteria bacterium]|nr:hypothetical protein [Alphaproteobacteria bacterium]TAD89332.1 MAG: hypothetical protein EAZ99_10275 [Alphaproteobacteria bacterium]
MARVLSVASVLVAVCLAATPAVAQTSRTDTRETNQERRIQQGTSSGQLTVQEQNRLNNGQARVDAAQGRAAADGTVTARERRRLETLQDRQSARIARQRHDRNRTN